jgi:hypothetical protein
MAKQWKIAHVDATGTYTYKETDSPEIALQFHDEVSRDNQRYGRTEKAVLVREVGDWKTEEPPMTIERWKETYLGSVAHQKLDGQWIVRVWNKNSTTNFGHSIAGSMDEAIQKAFELWKKHEEVGG